MSNTLVENYYNHICQDWDVTPTSDTYTGYDTLKSVGPKQMMQAKINQLKMYLISIVI